MNGPFNPCFQVNHSGWRTLKIEKLANVTCQWYPSDSADQFDPDHPQQKYTAESFQYVHNSWGYRSDEFEEEGPSIMFHGCSLTQGTGLPLEHMWTWLFTRMVEQALGRPVRHLNVAHGGKGLDYVTRTLILSKEVVKPDFHIYYLPIGSRFEFANIGDEFHDVIPNDKRSIQRAFNFMEIPGVVKMTNPRQNMLRLAQCLGVIHSYGDDLAWNSWGMQDFQFLWKHTGGRYESTRFDASLQFENQDRARDLMHPGPDANMAMAESAFENLGERVIDTLRRKNP